MLTCCSVGADGKTILLLGLSAANVERLEADDPIRISRESHGVVIPEDLVILIMHGDTEAAIEARLRQMGVIGDGTIFNQQRPL